MESRRVSLLKALSWRVIAITVTTSVAYLWSGDVTVAASIGAIDSLIKIFAYYLHERAWIRGLEAANEPPKLAVDGAPATSGARTC